MLNFDALLGERRRRGARAARRRSARSLQFDDPDQHPVHVRHHRGAKGRDADASQHRQQRLLRRRGDALQPSAIACAFPVPLYHCFGMVLGNLVCITHGATMVFPGEGFDAAARARRPSQAERCTALHGVPTMFIADARASAISRSFDLSSLRTGIMAGAPCPIEMMQQVIERMHMREVTIGYGMTETSPISFQSSMDDSARAARFDRRPHAAAPGSEDRRRATGASCRSARPASCARAATA